MNRSQVETRDEREGYRSHTRSGCRKRAELPEPLEFLQHTVCLIRITRQGLSMTISHEHCQFVAGELAGALEGLDRLRIHFLLTLRGAQPELRGYGARMQLYDLQRL